MAGRRASARAVHSGFGHGGGFQLSLPDRVTDRAHIIETGTESLRFRLIKERRMKG
jgi:hypothetical protein